MTDKEIKITIICWNCDRKFSILLGEVKEEVAVYLGLGDERLGSTLIRPKKYLVPCPDCQAENEVMLP